MNNSTPRYGCKIFNDEPTSNDSLYREHYADAFAELVENCDTPTVVGLYGTWGIGKTSLMKQIADKLNKDQLLIVNFDPWMHQFDDSPALALMHTLVDQLSLGTKGKKLLTVISAAFGSALLKATTNLTVKDIDEFGKRYAKEQFTVRDARVNMQNHFRELIKHAQTRDGIKKRIVFFIDDLDRCLPESILKVLEALKLYLNIEGCIYFLAVDKTTLEESIRFHYKDVSINHVKYLDKIVQLPFNIPAIAPENIEEYINSILPEGLHDCCNMLANGLGDNPRHVKRFINMLSLNHNLAKNLKIKNYDPILLSVLLYIEYRNPKFYHVITNDPGIFNDIVSNIGNLPESIKEIINIDIRLKKVIEHIDIKRVIEKDELFPYIHLTTITSVSEIALAEEMGKSELYNLYVDIATNGDRVAVDFLMSELEKRKDIATAKLIDYCLGLISTTIGYKRIKYYLENGTSRQKYYATLYLERN